MLLSGNILDIFRIAVNFRKELKSFYRNCLKSLITLGTDLTWVLVAQLKAYVISTIVELVSASKWKNISISEDALYLLCV